MLNTNDGSADTRITNSAKAVGGTMLIHSRANGHLPILVVAFGAATAIAMAAALPAQAKCAPGTANDGGTYLDGWYSSTYSPTGGVYSDIFNYSPWVQPGNLVVAWSMLDVANANAWAQVGWMEVAYGTRYTFTQWMTCINCSAYTDYYSAFGINTYTQYKVLWNNACGGCVSMYAGGTRLEYHYVSWTPNEGQIYGEIHTYSDQMPGAQQQHEDFSN